MFSRDNLPRIKDRGHVINFDKKQNQKTHWVSLFIIRNRAVYFDLSGIVYIPHKVLRKNKDKSIIQDKFGIKSDDCIMCRFYCIAFIE